MAGQMVTFASNGKIAEGYLSLPPSGRGAGVLVIQEWWGLVPHIKEVADRLARAGYVALAPDLYHGKTTTEPDEAGKLMMSLNIEEAAKDMDGAYDYLKSNPACSGKIGCVGFCMGGGLALWVATLRPVDACAVYYGAALPGVQPDLSKLSGPVLGHYAEHDEWATPAQAHELEAKIRSLGKHAQIYVYTGVQHAFFNDTRPEVYNKGAAELSWDRTLGFLKAQLG
ncbi:MAG: dienelactone hydrolase family protein [Chloroflexota bacterium]|nr:dienelactone hydrolase family protein [Chloroflexota bacterium]